MQDARNTQSLVRPTGNTQIPIPPPIQQAAVCAIHGRPNEYFVEAEDRRTAYRVLWDGTRGQCTCARFPRDGNCIHINAVKNRPQEVVGKSVKDTEGILSRHFSDNQLDCDQYDDKGVKFEEVVKRLNEALGAMGWSFSHEEPVDCGDSFTCAGRLEVEIGGVRAWKENVGYCRYVDEEQADGMAGARTGSVQGALVNCALLFGVGLEQSSKPTVNTERPQSGFAKSFAERSPF